jgi:glycosyltransferase involved in cell wall biosynthesis
LKRRIAYVVGRYPAIPHIGLLREIQALRRQGVEVETISIHKAPPEQLLSSVDREEAERTYALLPAQWLTILRVHAAALLRAPRAYLGTAALSLRLGPPGLKARVWRLFYFAEAILVWDHCRRTDVRHLHAHHLNQASDAAMLACRFANRRGGDPWTWSFTVHGPTDFYNVAQSRVAEKARDASLVVCISDFCRSQVMGQLETDFWHKLNMVYCGIDPDEFMPRPGSPDDGAFRIMCVSRMVPVKGLHVLVRAVARLVEEGLDVRATLIGQGPGREQVRALAAELGIEDRIELPGAVGEDEIRDHHAAADVFCLPSFAEGLPAVLLEAMAMERPVVTTRIMGIPELVQEGVNGLMVAPGNVDQLVDALRELATDPERRRRMGRAGRERVVAEFSVDGTARKLATLFGQVGRNGGAPVRRAVELESC